MNSLEKILFDFSLGDGHLGRSGYLDIVHCEQQKEYLEYKAKKLDAQIKIKNNNGFLSYRIGYSGKEYGKNVRKKLYGVMGHKYFSKEVVKNMDLYSFAILYCDDGSLIAKRKKGKVHAYDLVISIYGKQSECENLIRRLEQWDLHFTLKRNKGAFSIRCGTKEARKFLSLIRPEIPEFECFKNTKLKDISK